jgi:hypothetical protein
MITGHSLNLSARKDMARNFALHHKFFHTSCINPHRSGCVFV